MFAFLLSFSLFLLFYFLLFSSYFLRRRATSRAGEIVAGKNTTSAAVVMKYTNARALGRNLFGSESPGERFKLATTIRHQRKSPILFCPPSTRLSLSIRIHRKKLAHIFPLHHPHTHTCYYYYYI